MILIGHEWVPYAPLYAIDSIEAIANTPANSTLFFVWSEERLSLAHHCRTQKLSFAVGVQTYREVLFANAWGAAYIVVPRDLALKAQAFANEYLSDAKILLRGEERDLEWAAQAGIDGILFEKGVVYGSG